MPVVELRGIGKRFGATVALDGVDFSVDEGEVHALVGENGSGKSTLMRVLAGVVKRDSGDLFLNGQPFEPRSPKHARLSGVAMIHQELSLCNELSVEENIMLGMEQTRGGLIRKSEQRAVAADAMQRLGFDDVPLDARTGSLPISIRQGIEISRALAIGCKVLILDEPTSSLTQADTERLFQVVAAMKAEGRAIVYISHFFDEINRIADRFTVLRDGKHVGEGIPTKVEDDQIIEMMVGREITDLYPRSKRSLGEVLLDIKGLSGVRLPTGASLQVRRGEVVGIAGLGGSGRTEFLRAIFGLDPVRTGTVRVASYSGFARPSRRWKQGAGMLSEDRNAEGIASGLTVADNALLTVLPPWVSDRWERESTEKLIDKLSIKTLGPMQPVAHLSGGNQQKVALSRLLQPNVDVLLLDEPTRGIDVASKEQIYRLIDEAACAGKAVLMVSSYLPELLGVCDRIAVMSRGTLGKPRDVAEWSQESLMEEAVSQ